jgi:hypothetical protein
VTTKLRKGVGALSEETVLKFKLATLVTIGMGIISIAVIFISIWVSSISAQGSANTTDIATLKECTRNLSSSTQRIEVGVDNINKSLNEHVRRGK